MKKTYIFIIVSLLCVTLAVLSAFPVSAYGTVTYNGNSEKFIFEPGSEYSPTDLFTDYKNVMPGDSITQQVYVKNDISNQVKVNIYMRALGPTPDTDEYVSEEANVAFLSQLDLKVAVRDGAELFKAPANETAGLTEWVLLGTFYSGAQVTLDVTLDVPLDLGNEYQNSIGFLDWQFKVEEFPVEPSDPSLPETGDDNLIVVCGVAACVCVAVILFVIIPMRRRKEQEEA
ncbi:MAG: hypothetical protein IJB65_02455 [Clostridia bacterium]|nr:hypothetical protein [Clostridia bacterium]